MKFFDIVKVNTCLLFYDYFNNNKFATLPVSLVSELHNYNTRSASSNQLFITSFRTNLRRFCPTIIGKFFWNNIPQTVFSYVFVLYYSVTTGTGLLGTKLTNHKVN